MDELAQRALAGDKDAESELFETLLVRFKYLAKRRVAEEDHEDLAQEACQTVFEKYHTERFKISFTAWAHGVLKMKVGNYYQARKRHAGRSSEFNEAVNYGDGLDRNPDLKRWLMDCLRQLTKSTRQYARIVNLAYQGFSTEDICSKLDITSNHYYVNLSRGRSLLRTCLQEKGASV